MFKKLIIASITLSSLVACATSSEFSSHVDAAGKDMGSIKMIDFHEKQVNGFLVAQGVLYNTGRSIIDGYYRCKFFDSNELQVGDEQAWQLVTIYPGLKENLKCVAMTKEAMHVKIEFSKNIGNVIK